MKPPIHRHPRRRFLLAGIAALLVLGLAAGFSAARPVPILVDGAKRRVAAGATTADLLRKRMVAASQGDLVSIKGEVLEPGGGEPPLVLCNGEVVRAETRLFGGDDVVSRSGADVIESVEVTMASIPFTTVFEGTGSLSELTTEGVPGSARITRGAVSGAEVSRVVVREPVNAVVRRIHPAPGMKMVALTFDDGPWPVFTDQVLDVLRAHDVHATFFALGTRVKLQPGTAVRIVQEGHQIANHSLGHASLSASSAKEAKRQIVKGREAIKRYAGVDTLWLRPPYGAMDTASWKIAKSTKSRVIRWTVDSEDWRKPGAEKIAKRVVRDVRPGSVVLFHDGGGDRRQTVEALPAVIEQLRAQGYVFVTVEELFAATAAGKQAKK